MNFSRLVTPLLETTFVILTPPAIIARNDIRTVGVQFARSTNSAVIEDSITGYEVIDYVLRAREGQSMNVSMATDNTSNYFNIVNYFIFF